MSEESTDSIRAVRACKQNLCFNWDRLAGAKKSAVIRNRAASLRWNLLGTSLQSQHTEAVVQTGPRLHCIWAATILPGGTGFESRKGPWRAAEVWPCERLLVKVSSQEAETQD